MTTTRTTSLPAGFGAKLPPDDEVVALLLLLGSSARLEGTETNSAQDRGRVTRRERRTGETACSTQDASGAACVVPECTAHQPEEVTSPGADTVSGGEFDRVPETHRVRRLEQRRRGIRLVELPASSSGFGCRGNRLRLVLLLRRVSADEADDGFSCRGERRSRE